MAGAITVLADFGLGLEETGAQTLTRQLQETEGADPTELDARTIGFHRLFQAPLHFPVVPGFLHIDEVDHDEAGEIAQAELPRNLVRGLQIGLERRLLDMALTRRLAGVDVDRNQRLRRVDHDRAARLELHLGFMHQVQLLLYVVAIDQRNLGIRIVLHMARMAGHQHLHEGLGSLVALVALDQNLLGIARVEIADRPLDEIGFLVNQSRRRRLQRVGANIVPQTEQIFVVAPDFRLRALGSGGTHDDRHTLGDQQLAQHRLQTLAVRGIPDLARDASALGRVRHENAVTPRQRQVGGQGRALRAPLLLGHLHQHDLLALDHLLDLVAAHQLCAATGSLLDLVAPDRIDAALGLDLFDRTAGAAVPGRRLETLGIILRTVGLRGCRSLAVGGGIFRIGTVFFETVFLGLVGGPSHRALGCLVEGLVRCLVVRCPIGLGTQGLFFGQQCFAVGDRNAVVIGMDFAERQETVTITAVIYKGGLERRLDLGDLCEIDIALELRLSGGFVVEFFDPSVGNHHDPRLVRVGGIDQHTLCHVVLTPEHARRPGTGLRRNRRRRGRRETRRLLRRDLRQRLRSVGERDAEHRIAAKWGRQHETLRVGYKASASPSPRASILSLLVPPRRKRAAFSADIGRQSRWPPGLHQIRTDRSADASNAPEPGRSARNDACAFLDLSGADSRRRIPHAVRLVGQPLDFGGYRPVCPDERLFTLGQTSHVTP